MIFGWCWGWLVDYFEFCVGVGYCFYCVGFFDLIVSGLNVCCGGVVIMDYVVIVIVVMLVIFLGVGIVVNELFWLK